MTRSSLQHNRMRFHLRGLVSLFLLLLLLANCECSRALPWPWAYNDDIVPGADDAGHCKYGSVLEGLYNDGSADTGIRETRYVDCPSTCSSEGEIYCHDGRLYNMAGTGRTSCWDTCLGPYGGIARCRKGCRKDCHDRITVFSLEQKEDSPLKIQQSLCEEHRQKYPYERCSTDEECSPGLSKVDDTTHNVTNYYLRCDPAQKRCVERPPTEVKDFNQICGQELDGMYKPFLDATLYNYVAVRTKHCSKGYCYAWSNRNEGTTPCLYQGCTTPCVNHEDCPQNARCIQIDYVPEHDRLRTTTAVSTSKAFVCMPGYYLPYKLKQGKDLYTYSQKFSIPCVFPKGIQP